MGKNVEKTEDFSERADRAIQETQNAVAEGRLVGALEQLFQLEKSSRNAGDFKSTTRLAEHIVRLALESKDVKQVSDSLLLIAKRRGQEKKVCAVSFPLPLSPSHQKKKKKKKR